MLTYPGIHCWYHNVWNHSHYQSNITWQYLQHNQSKYLILFRLFANERFNSKHPTATTHVSSVYRVVLHCDHWTVSCVRSLLVTGPHMTKSVVTLPMVTHCSNTGCLLGEISCCTDLCICMLSGRSWWNNGQGFPNNDNIIITLSSLTIIWDWRFLKDCWDFAIWDSKYFLSLFTQV